MNAIEKLAEKLGLAVEKVWPEYVKYVFVESISSLIIGSILVLLASIMARRAYRVKGECDCEGEIMIIAIAAPLAAIIGIVMISVSVAGVINPEGAAIRMMVK